MAVVERDDALTGRAHEAVVLRGEQHTCPFRSPFAKHVRERGNRSRVERGGGFVNQEERGRQGKRCSNRHPAPEPEGEHAEPFVAPRAEAEPLDHRITCRVALWPAPMKRRNETDVLDDGELVEAARDVWDEGDLAPRLDRSDRLTGDGDLTSVVMQKSGDDAQRCRLAAPVGADEADDLALRDNEVEPADDRAAAEPLDETVDTEWVGRARESPPDRLATCRGRQP